MDIFLDFAHVANITELHQYLKREFRLPDYYGNNLDALYDCLSEKDIRCITVVHFSEMKKCIGDYADMLLRVFFDAGIEVKQ